MAVDFVTVASAQTVSSAFPIERTDRALWVGVASHAALGWRLAFAPSLTGPFLPVGNDAIGATFQFSGANGRYFVGCFPNAPASFARIETSGATTATTSVLVTGG
jgi:hypothetical protein